MIYVAYALGFVILLLLGFIIVVLTSGGSRRNYPTHQAGQSYDPAAMMPDFPPHNYPDSTPAADTYQYDNTPPPSFDSAPSFDAGCGSGGDATGGSTGTTS